MGCYLEQELRTDGVEPSWRDFTWTRSSTSWARSSSLSLCWSWSVST